MKKTNNKGFSLVELIIVIAIMAILIGVLAPQYIKYVEKSRISADKDTIDSLTKAVQTACTDDDYYDALSANMKVEVSKTNGISTTGTALQNAIDEFYGTQNGADANKKFKSKAFAGDTAIIQIVEVTNSSTSAKSLQASVYTTGTVASNPYDPADFK